MNHIKANNKVLLVWNSSSSEDIRNYVNQINTVIGDGNLSLENSDMLTMTCHAQSSFDVVLSNIVPPHKVEHNEKLFAIVLHMLKPGGKLILHECSSEAVVNLKLNGFINPAVEDSIIVCNKPNFEVGSSMKLGKKVWKIDDTVESAWNTNDNDIIDSDQLLDENDKNKTASAPLKVCGTTGQRKACANCSCGLAEELAGEVKQEPKSSCGSCYLGDAFRCASCPYLGMPAFKPGEKVLLADLKPDI